MSSTGRNKPGNERRADDFYQTPSWCVHRLLDYLELFERRTGRQIRLIEPFAGNGAIIRAVKSHPGRQPTEIYLNELRESHRQMLSALQPTRLVFGDFRDPALARALDELRLQVPRAQRPYRRWLGTNIIITNPPYSHAMEAAQWCRRNADRSFLLLRLSWAGTARRHAFMRANKPNMYILPERPSFTGRGTDSTDYAWFEFAGEGSHYTTTGQFAWLDRTPEAERKRCNEEIRNDCNQ